MAEYQQYINALRKCAKEHKYEIVPFAHIITADLCNGTADLLEKLETENDKSIIIPKGATNGDMIKAMFHNCECSVHEYMGIKCGIDVKIYFYENQYFTVWFPTNWWNAPYKKEVVE